MSQFHLDFSTSPLAIVLSGLEKKKILKRVLFLLKCLSETKQSYLRYIIVHYIQSDNF